MRRAIPFPMSPQLLGYIALFCCLMMLGQAAWSLRTGTYYHRFRVVSREGKPFLFWVWLASRIYLGGAMAYLAVRLLSIRM